MCVFYAHIATIFKGKILGVVERARFPDESAGGLDASFKCDLERRQRKRFSARFTVFEQSAPLFVGNAFSRQALCRALKLAVG